jgi:hypothetical protein
MCILVAHPNGSIPKSKSLTVRRYDDWSCNVHNPQTLQARMDDEIDALKDEIADREKLVGILFPETIEEAEEVEVVEEDDDFLPPMNDSLLRD